MQFTVAHLHPQPGVYVYVRDVYTSFAFDIYAYTTNTCTNTSVWMQECCFVFVCVHISLYACVSVYAYVIRISRVNVHVRTYAYVLISVHTYKTTQRPCTKMCLQTLCVSVVLFVQFDGFKNF